MLTIGVPVYNQIDLVDGFLKNTLQYPGDDIEVLIIDDCSTEDIQGLVASYGDKRLSYYRNENNLGHDGNIIELFKHAKGEYLFLFRVRDVVITDSLSKTIDNLRNNDHLVYLTASALSEHVGTRIKYKEDKLFRVGEAALTAHNSLYIHPSGSIYKVGIADYDRLFSFVKELGKDDYKRLFLVHDLLRMQYAFVGDFYIQSDANWVYSDSLNAKDKAVNSIKKEYVYSPRLTSLRLKLSMIWAKKVIPQEFLSEEYIRLIRVYMGTATYRYYGACKKNQAANHYGRIDDNVSMKALFNGFDEMLNSIERELDISDKQYYMEKRRLFIKERLKSAIYLVSIPLHNVLKRLLRLV